MYVQFTNISCERKGSLLLKSLTPFLFPQQEHLLVGSCGGWVNMGANMVYIQNVLLNNLIKKIAFDSIKLGRLYFVLKKNFFFYKTACQQKHQITI